MLDEHRRVGVPISIHAPVKGATFQLSTNDALISRISIHAPVKGATDDFHVYYSWDGEFQSTHP